MECAGYRLLCLVSLPVWKIWLVQIPDRHLTWQNGLYQAHSITYNQLPPVPPCRIF